MSFGKNNNIINSNIGDENVSALNGLGKGFFKKVDEVKEHDVEGINIIRIISNVIDINVSSTNEDKVTSHLHGSTNKSVEIHFDIKVEKNELIIETKLFGNSVQIDLDLDVAIPAKRFSKIIIENITGSVDVLADLKVNDFMISTETGDVECNGNINSEVIKVITKTGDTKLGEIIRTGLLEIESNTGDIETNTSFSSLNCKTNTGDIEVNTKLVTKTDIIINTNTGDVELNLKKAKKLNIEFRSNTGEADNNYSEDREGYDANIRVKTNTGDLDIY